MKTMNMTIQEYYDNLYTIRNHDHDNKYFGKKYIFISNVIDPKYIRMENTHIISIMNETQSIRLDMQDVSKIVSQLNKYSNTDEIQIIYDHIIEKDDGTKIDLKTDPIYIRIKHLVRHEIENFFTPLNI